MTLLDFARGPALEVATAIFVFGVSWRLLSLLLLPWSHDKSVPRTGTPPAIVGAARGFVRHLWPQKPFARTFILVTLNGYAFHLGLAVIVFGLAQHILFLRGLFGVSWPNLPSRSHCRGRGDYAGFADCRSGAQADEPGTEVDFDLRRLFHLVRYGAAGRYRPHCR